MSRLKRKSKLRKRRGADPRGPKSSVPSIPEKLNGASANQYDKSRSRMHVVFEFQENGETGNAVVEKHYAEQHGEEGCAAKGRDNQNR